MHTPHLTSYETVNYWQAEYKSICLWILTPHPHPTAPYVWVHLVPLLEWEGDGEGSEPCPQHCLTGEGGYPLLRDKLGLGRLSGWESVEKLFWGQAESLVLPVCASAENTIGWLPRSRSVGGTSRQIACVACLKPQSIAALLGHHLCRISLHLWLWGKEGSRDMNRLIFFLLLNYLTVPGRVKSMFSLVREDPITTLNGCLFILCSVSG